MSIGKNKHYVDLICTSFEQFNFIKQCEGKNYIIFIISMGRTHTCLRNVKVKISVIVLFILLCGID